MPNEVLALLWLVAQATASTGNLVSLDGEELHMGIRTFVFLAVQLGSTVAVIASLVTTVKYVKTQLVRVEDQGRVSTQELVGWIRRVEHESRAEIKELDRRVDGIDNRTTRIETVCNLQHGPGLSAGISTGPVQEGKSPHEESTPPAESEALPPSNSVGGESGK